MEKKKGNETQIFLLMLVLVVLMVIVAVNYVYRPLAEERDALREENFRLNSRWIELVNMSVYEEDYKRDIQAAQVELSKLLNRYSAGNTPEKSIKFISDLEEALQIGIPNITFSSPNLVSSVKMPMIQNAEDGSYTIQYYDVSLLKETLSVNYSCTYDQMKELADYINNYGERMNIQSISVNYNSETDELAGNLVLNLYTVTGTGKQYEEPSITDIRLGEENIFSN